MSLTRCFLHIEWVGEDDPTMTFFRRSELRSELVTGFRDLASFEQERVEHFSRHQHIGDVSLTRHL